MISNTNEPDYIFQPHEVLRYKLDRKFTIICPELQYKKGCSGSVPFIDLTGSKLEIYRGYEWDGPSGPALDTTDFIMPSLVHDALYDLIRGEVLELSDRMIADSILKRLCYENGMPAWRAWYVFYAVRFGGWYAFKERYIEKVKAFLLWKK